jgi:hypothetical protein
MVRSRASAFVLVRARSAGAVLALRRGRRAATIVAILELNSIPEAAWPNLVATAHTDARLDLAVALGVGSAARRLTRFSKLVAAELRREGPSTVPPGSGAASPAPAPPPPPPPPPKLANLWVHTASSGSCARSETPVEYDPATACASAAAAWDAARNVETGTLIMFKSGIHAGWSVTGPRTPTARDYVVFASAPGEQVLIRGEIKFGCWTCPVATTSASYVILRDLTTDVHQPEAMDPGVSRYGISFNGGKYFKLENVTAGNFFFTDSENVEVRGGSYGPCRRPQSALRWDCQINKVFQSRNVLIDGVDIHDYGILPSCTSACHWRSLFLAELDGFTMRNSTVRNSVFEPWFSIINPTNVSRNLLIENNYFGASTLYGRGFALAWCTNAGGSVAYENVTIRFNSFSRNTGLAIPGSGHAGELGCRVRNVRIYGNIIGQKPAGWDGENPCGVSDTVWSYNVFVNSANRGVCGVGDVSVVSPIIPFYKNDNPNPILGDYELAGPPGAADDLVPVWMGCPATDRLWTARPQSGFCDAGAHER